MPRSPGSRLYWDANIMLAYVNGEAGRTDNIRAFLADVDKGEREIVTSMLSVVEVAFAAEEKAGGKVDPGLKEKIEGLWLPNSPIKRVEFHFVIAENARSLIRRAMLDGWRLRPADAVHLATAQRMGVKECHTYEKEAIRTRWANLIGIQVDEPTHPVLPML